VVHSFLSKILSIYETNRLLTTYIIITFIIWLKNTKNMLIKFITILTLFISFFTSAEKPKDTSHFLYGLGLIANKGIYKGYDIQNMLLPIVGYKSEKLNIFGPFVSYEVEQFAGVKVFVKAAPRFQGFDDNDSYIFEGMADRKISMDAGLGLNYKKNDWKISFSSMFDVLNRSNGVEITSSISHTFRYGPFFIEPRITFSYLDNNHVDYYYGVGKEEVSPNRTEYIGKGALNKSIDLSIATPIFLGGYTQINLKRTWFDSEITNSPLVDKNSDLILMFLYTRKF
jgi:outer membrane protein